MLYLSVAALLSILLLIALFFVGYFTRDEGRHRHPSNLRRDKNVPVDVEEIIKTSEIRIG